jgi:hypothetical protein
MAAANGEVTKPRVISDKVEVITSKVLLSPLWLGLPYWNICVTNDRKSYTITIMAWFTILEYLCDK